MPSSSLKYFPVNTITLVMLQCHLTFRKNTFRPWHTFAIHLPFLPPFLILPFSSAVPFDGISKKGNLTSLYTMVSYYLCVHVELWTIQRQRGFPQNKAKGHGGCMIRIFSIRRSRLSDGAHQQTESTAGAGKLQNSFQVDLVVVSVSPFCCLWMRLCIIVTWFLILTPSLCKMKVNGYTGHRMPFPNLTEVAMSSTSSNVVTSANVITSWDFRLTISCGSGGVGDGVSVWWCKLNISCHMCQKLLCPPFSPLIDLTLYISYWKKSYLWNKKNSFHGHQCN